MIEKIIHVYYGKTINTSKYFIGNKWLLNNYEFIQWDDTKLIEFCKKNELPQNNMMLRTVCKLGGFFVDSNYQFFKSIDIFLDYNFLSVFDSNNNLKFYGSKKENQILNEIYNKYGKIEDIYIKEYENNKIVNPIYLYPQKKTNSYKII